MKLKLIAILPAIFGYVAADTLSIDLHKAGTCDDAAFQTFTIGNINECHDASQESHTYEQYNIAQSFFGLNLGIRALRNAGCSGPESTNSLSNVRSCVFAEGRSFLPTYIS